MYRRKSKSRRTGKIRPSRAESNLRSLAGHGRAAPPLVFHARRPDRRDERAMKQQSQIVPLNAERNV